MKRAASAFHPTALITLCFLACLLPSLLACSANSVASDSSGSASSVAGDSSGSANSVANDSASSASESESISSSSATSSSSSSAVSSSSSSASEATPKSWVYAGKDAGYILNSLKEKGLNVGEIEVFDETTDPNGRLGLDGSYTSKATFIDSRFDAKEAKSGSELNPDFGGTLEVFESDADCIERQNFISDTINSTGGVGDMYVYRYGKALLRIGCELDPSQIAEYVEAFLEGADKSQCSKTGMAADGYTPLEKTGKETELYGLTFSVGEGWSMGNPVNDDGYSMIYLQKGTYYDQQCYIGKLEGDPSSPETADQILQTMLAGTGDVTSEMQAVDIDGVTAYRGSARSADTDLTWHYTVVPIDDDFVIACYYVTDKAPENAVSDFEKSLHLSSR